jgi:SAM-dependent methyltransferase
MNKKNLYPAISVLVAILTVTSAVLSFPIIAFSIIGIFIFISLLDGTYTFVRKNYNRRKIFCDRDDATPSMKKDLKKYKYLAFIGVSHIKLHIYLEETIKLNKSKELPWESIVVFYATPELGQMWERENFEYNIKKSRINIVNVLFNANYRKLIPNLKTIQFRQCNSKCSFSGCFCGNENHNTNSIALQVIYSVNHLPIDNQTEKSWTLRLERWNASTADDLFNGFEKSFFEIKNRAETICDIKFSLWEWSAVEWNDFVKQYNNSFQAGICKMIHGLDMNNKYVLDLGAGTGNVANYLIQGFEVKKITLVDASANMLKAAKESIGDQAIYELFQLPLHSDYFLRNNRGKYDYIISHLSMQSLMNTMNDLSSFVSTCNDLLKSNGYVILAFHNSYEIQFEQRNQQHDKFRIDLINEIENNGFALKEGVHIPFQIEDISRVFTEKHFKQMHFEEFELRFTMHNRGCLWKIPAVLDSLVDVEKIGISKGKEMVQKVYEKNRNFATPNRRMVVFHFQKIF